MQWWFHQCSHVPDASTSRFVRVTLHWFVRVIQREHCFKSFALLLNLLQLELNRLSLLQVFPSGNPREIVGFQDCPASHFSNNEPLGSIAFCLIIHQKLNSFKPAAFESHLHRLGRLLLVLPRLCSWLSGTIAGNDFWLSSPAPCSARSFGWLL